ncbi:diguanylate cyclase [Marinomonas sp. A79]|uniref:diguanylate cyclase n=1 Tax=Marinomonas vulgaris TaxID=2823372 RepID=A0ABS5HCP8_9GAMM|nr:GGDEF domain-containing protein [Marinomonas vulgaris]MBR7889158.1 diguanylate cyclase [Marinomonas vulgaris]
MTPSTLYFSPLLTDWTQPVNRQLSAFNKKVQWQVIDEIQQSPVSSILLVAEQDLQQTDWPLLASRKAVVILDNWRLPASVAWIERGATNCFARHDDNLISWLVSELSRFALNHAERTEDSVLQVIIDAIPTPIFFKDHLHIYRGCNVAFCDSIGFERDNIVGHSVYDIAPKELADKYYHADNQLLAEGGTQRYEADVKFADGSLHEIEFNKAVFTSHDGKAIGQVGVMLDITERNQLIRQLDKSSHTDPLTGFENRRAFNQVIHREFDQLESSVRKLSLMTLDIDFFKHINDRFGHGGGDQALQLISEWLQNQLRDTDSVYRVGGEEFYLLMRDTDIHTAYPFAESLCKNMATHLFTIKQQDIHITFSIGVIEINPAIELENTLDMVDKALYEAKADGRNCVRPVFE